MVNPRHGVSRSRDRSQPGMGVHFSTGVLLRNPSNFPSRLNVTLLTGYAEYNWALNRRARARPCEVVRNTRVENSRGPGGAVTTGFQVRPEGLMVHAPCRPLRQGGSVFPRTREDPARGYIKNWNAPSSSVNLAAALTGLLGDSRSARPRSACGFWWKCPSSIPFRGMAGRLLNTGRKAISSGIRRHGS